MPGAWRKVIANCRYSIARRASLLCGVPKFFFCLDVRREFFYGFVGLRFPGVGKTEAPCFFAVTSIRAKLAWQGLKKMVNS